MTLPRALRPALVGVVVAGLVLTGCTSEEPTPVPTTSAATSTEPTPDTTTDPAEITPPEKPTLMATNDAIGARAAAEYFLSLYGYVFQTGDLTEWDAMCLAESSFCGDVRNDVESNAAAGLSQTGGELTFVVTSVVDPAGQLDSYEVVGSTSQAALEMRSEDGSVVESIPDKGAVSTSVFLYMSDDGQWKVRAVGVGDAP